MGSTFANSTVVGADRGAIVAALSDTTALVSETIGDATVVFSEEDEVMMGSWPTARRLSSLLGCVVLGAMVYDDDLVAYAVFREGNEQADGQFPLEIAEEMAEMSDEEVAPPDPQALVTALGRGNLDAVRAVMQGTPVFASESLQVLLAALDLPTAAANWGYRYLAHDRGSWDGGSLTPTGGAG